MIPTFYMTLGVIKEMLHSLRILGQKVHQQPYHEVKLVLSCLCCVSLKRSVCSVCPKHVKSVLPMIFMMTTKCGIYWSKKIFWHLITPSTLLRCHLENQRNRSRWGSIKNSREAPLKNNYLCWLSERDSKGLFSAFWVLFLKYLER